VDLFWNDPIIHLANLSCGTSGSSQIIAQIKSFALDVHVAYINGPFHTCKQWTRLFNYPCISCRKVFDLANYTKTYIPTSLQAQGT
jgi:hypothetical protein